MNGQVNTSPTCKPVVILCLIKIFHEKMSSILPAHTNEAQQTCHNVMALLQCGLSLRLITQNPPQIFTEDGALAKAPPPLKKIKFSHLLKIRKIIPIHISPVQETTVYLSMGMKRFPVTVIWSDSDTVLQRDKEKQRKQAELLGNR